MSVSNLLEETLILALSLTPKERLWLITQVALSIERDLDDSADWSNQQQDQ